MTECRVRAARVEDAGLIHDFILELAEYERLSDAVDARPDDVKAVLFCDQPRAFCAIAEWNGEPAGFALWFYNYSTFRGRHGIYLEDLFVRPQFRGQGLGKHLLAHLAQIAVRENCVRLEWSVLDWNEPSIEFYKALGAVPTEGWTVFRLSGEALARLGRS